MKKLLTLTLLLTASLAYAQEPAATPEEETDKGHGYFAMGLHNGSYEEDEIADEWKPKALNFTFGYQINEHVAFEGRILKGTSSDSTGLIYCDFSACYDFDAELELNNAISIFVKPQISDPKGNVTLYGLLGFTKGKLDYTLKSGGYEETYSESESGLSTGLGLSAGSKKVKGYVEFVKYLDTDEFSYTGMNVGIQIAFK